MAFTLIVIAGVLGGILACLSQIREKLVDILEELRKQNTLTEEAKMEAESAKAIRLRRSELGLGRP